MSTYRNPRLLVAVRDLPCQWPSCGVEDGTVCAAHSNEYRHGKGESTKASDAAVAALCFRHHSELDQGKNMSRDERREGWAEAHTSTLRLLIERGILGVIK